MATRAKDIPDDQLLAMLREPASLERAYRLLIEKYQKPLYWHIRGMVGCHADADDVLQNCFMKAFRNMDNFRGDARLYTWLYRIATNEAISFLKRMKRKRASSLDEEENFLAAQLRSDPYFDGSELQVELRKAVEQLPDKQKIVFCMRYYEEVPYKEMSELLDTSEGALKASYHHAVKKIEHHFREVEI
ncbi:MAG: RNA polymerase sigma factor [Saprospiraceae bacterium]|nr:RNA polymerase sigma factor [Saprospiraceae bacterium]